MFLRRTIVIMVALAALAGPSGAAAAPMPAGTYEVRVTSATGRFGLVPLTLPFAPDPARISVGPGMPATWSLGSIAIPPFPLSVPGFDITVSTSFPGEVVVQFDPATGDAWTQVQFFASFSGTYTAPGQAPIPFSCTIADAVNPVVIRPTTARGASWNAETGEIKAVDNAFAMPPTACAPASFNGLLGDTSAGNNIVTIAATLRALPPNGAAPVSTSPPAAPVNTSPPAVTGTMATGSVLSASVGSWSGTAPISYAEQWQRCGSSCVNIAGATGSSYTLVAADVGARVRVVVTASNNVGSAQATSSEVGPIVPSAAQIKASLLAQVTPHGKAAKIAALLKKQGYGVSFTALSGGSVVIDWYYLPKGAHLASGKPKPKPVLVAVGTATFSRAGTLKIKIKLTAKGTRLIKHAKTLKLTAKGAFTPTAEHAVVATKKFTLTR